MKEFFRKAGIVSAFALAAAVSGAASATPFTITNSAFTNIGAGYGDGGANGAGNDVDTLLNVSFASNFAAQNFNLVNVGDTSGSFTFGTVTFKEQDISSAEAALTNLGVSATFTFSKPNDVGVQTVTATGTAYFGPVNGNDANPTDFIIDWNPVFVSFGNTGQFRIDVADLAFTTNTNQAATASVTLTKADVPEPGSLALAGLGLAAVGMVRRRKR